MRVADAANLLGVSFDYLRPWTDIEGYVVIIEQAFTEKILPWGAPQNGPMRLRASYKLERTRRPLSGSVIIPEGELF
jgi:hypothetical protein